MDERVDDDRRHRPSDEKPLGAAPAVAAHVPGHEEHGQRQRPQADEDRFQHVARDPKRRLERPAQNGGRLHHAVGELERRGEIPIEASAEPDHRHEPRQRRNRDHRQPDHDRADTAETDHGRSEPQREQEQQHRLAQSTRQAEISRREPGVGLTPLERAEGEVGDGDRAERLAGVRQPDGTVEPEERADGQERGRGQCGRPVVDLPGEIEHDEGRQSAEDDGEQRIGSGRITEPGVHDPAEPDVQDIARRMGLVLADVVLAQRERELDGVPVVEHPRAEGQSGEDRQQRERHRAEQVETRRGAGHGRRGTTRLSSRRLASASRPFAPRSRPS